MNRLRMMVFVLGLVTVALRADDETYTPHPKGSLTFNKDIAPVIYHNCTGCHRAGEVAPFELKSYNDVAKRAKQITRVTHSRYMPPWKAEPGYGEFQDERRLTSDQIGMIRQWAEEGAAEGDSKDLPPAPKYGDGWILGEPDMVLKMPEAYTLAKEGRDVFRCFVIPIDISEDKFVTAVDYKPGNRKIVHHAIFYLDNRGAARKKDEADPGPGYTSFGGPGIAPTGAIGGWAPGYSPRMLPEGMGKSLKKGSDLVMQVHFHPSGKEEQEQSTVALYFSKKPATKIIVSLPLAERKIDIPPGKKDYKVTKEYTTPIQTEIVGITPHAHYICKDMKVNATLPDGKTQPLIWIKDWDFSWQDQYIYKKPLNFPAGTKFSMEYTYDNSADNPRNPSNPPQQVKFGEQTKDEMAFAFINFVSPFGDIGILSRDRIQKLRDALTPNAPATQPDKKDEKKEEKKDDKAAAK